MRKFVVNVNGVSYEIEVEEISAGEAAQSKPIVAAAPVAPAAPAAAAAPAAVSAPTGSARVESPMPGTILDVKTRVGDKVKSGEILLILEAMKMENEILAPCDGTVISVAVQRGSSVNSGDLLVVIG
ncbi:MAG: biotin/lipoyl-containing protein [Clostridia bacterium]|nr:biotin/lipoyl-containing protein [Clostridia bacterium]